MRLRDVSVAAFADPDAGRVVNLPLSVVCQALVFRLASEVVSAPFTKLAIQVDSSIGIEIRAFVALSIGHAYLPIDPGEFDGATPTASRAAARRVIDAGLDAISAVEPWDDALLRTIIQEVTEHSGTYRYPGKRRLLDRARKVYYRSFYEFDEAGSRVTLETQDRSGRCLARQGVAERRPFFPYWTYFQAVDVRLLPDSIVYLDRDGIVVDTCPLPAVTNVETPGR